MSDRVQRNNDMLSNLTSQNLELEPLRADRTQILSKHLRKVQRQAKNLYNVINTGWTCQCSDPHKAHLRLDSRISGIEKECEDGPASLRFAVVFSRDTMPNQRSPWYWQETEIQLIDPLQEPKSETRLPVEETVPLNVEKTELQSQFSATGLLSRASAFFQKTPATSRKKATNAVKKGVRFEVAFQNPLKNTAPTTLSSLPNSHLKELPQIKDLCLTIQNYSKPNVLTNHCLGYLSYKSEPQALAVYPAHPPASRDSHPQPPMVSSLADLLWNHDNPARPYNQRLSRADRLELALTVASSILQLHDTPWLQTNSMSKADIHLIARKAQADQLTRLEDPPRAFIFSTFQPDSTNAGPTPATTAPSPHSPSFPGIPRNITLFALSVLLIELCLSRPFETLRNPTLDPLDANGKPNVLTDISTASRLMDDIYQEAGHRYGDAVRRCLHCDFNQRTTSLDDDAFRQAVYEGVVVPIGEVVRDFKGLT